MNRSLLSAVVVLLVALIVGLFFWLRTPVQHAPPSSAAAAAPTPSESERNAPLLATSPQDTEPIRAVAQVPATETTPVIAATPAVPESTTTARYDKKARGEVHLVVQDRFGVAVANAEVRLTGLRSKREPGSHWGLDEEVKLGKSAADGTVAISFPVWLDVELEVGFLTLAVRHPEFVTLELDMFAVKPEPQIVVLERGAFLIVSGYIGSKAHVVRDVAARLTDEVDVSADSWLPIKDGRLSNATIPPGEHGLYLTHRAADGRLFYSDATFFELAPSEQKELDLELFPALTIEGVLDRAVPRPIRAGDVMANLSLGSRESRAKTMRVFTARVAEDGSFVLGGLPPGSGQIIGMCDGWVSKRVSAGAADDDDDAKPEDRERTPQSIDTANAGTVFELLMEPTATMLADVHDPDGKPIAGATVSMWPNVTWRIGYSQVFLGRRYEGVSDAKGRAVVTNLPAGRCGYGVIHERWELPQGEQGFRYLSLDMKSGEQSTVTVRLQPRAGD
ncbi:MAG: carboxypeptidase-like regulatory domain-containing protein [Planctomycetota bacterium]